MTKLALIAAIAKNNAIGFENKLVYWLPNDLKRFKELTTGHTIIMGSNTFISYSFRLAVCLSKLAIIHIPFIHK